MDISEQQQRFAEWMREHGPMMYHVVNGFAMGSEREDLLQDVMIAVWKSIPSFRGQAKATTYLYRVCHNAALLWTRTETNYRRRVRQFGAFSHAEPITDTGPCNDERLAMLYSAIHRLKPVDRSLIVMALDGLTYREMAEVLGLSESNIGVKLNRIKTQLSLTLRGNENEPE